MSVTLRALPLDLPLARPFRTSRGQKTVASNLLVEIESNGVIGRGEGAPIPRYGQDQDSGLRALTGFRTPASSPFEQEIWLQAFDEQAPGELAARAALESALWDWAGQTAGRPVYELLSIDPTHTPESSFTISIDSPEGIRERVEEARAWPVLKLKMAGGDQDVAMVDALRELSLAPFRVDANEAWDYAEAVEKIAWLSTLGCELVEQPLPAGRLEESARLRESSPIPLAADEDALFGTDPALICEAYDLINLKLTRLGGLRRSIEWLHAARKRGCGVMVGCFAESTLGISASAILAPLCDQADLDGATLLASDPFTGSSVEDGILTLSKEPGLGVSPRSGSPQNRSSQDPSGPGSKKP
jgi:L-alanine-DL-glutamate epimerase-like enolase superfamily enzyme